MNQAYIQIKVKNGNNEVDVNGVQEQNLLDILHKNNIIIPNPCHGNGTCGKCKIKVLSGNLPITEADERILSKNELKQGIRLACKANIGKKQEEHKTKLKQGTKEICAEKADETALEELRIEVLEKSEENIIVQGIARIEDKRDCGKEEQNKSKNCFIAIDIGTTTIAMVLVEEETGKIIDTYTSLNHQRKYGADVISRIVAANDGKLEELKQLIEEDLWKGICRLISVDVNLTQVVIAGNTTMVHLLMGYSCLPLGKYPFYSEHLEEIDFLYNKKEMENEYRKIPITILPGISAFVGGDIVAGILACPGFETEEICLLVDLGTNGEMVLGNDEKLIVTSTAAGPAFEGGNITHGTASIPGSIEKVKIQNQKAIVKTINNKMPPIGICGTGIISAVAQLKKSKMIDSNGNLRYPYSEKGFSLWTQENGEKIVIYQKDIREFQMAKSAIRAGIEILMEEYGCDLKDVKHIYLAGGFGTHLSEEDVLDVGIFPKEWSGRIVPIGNGALQGTIQIGKVKVAEREKVLKWNQSNEEILKTDMKIRNGEYQKINNIIKNAKAVSLADHKKFQEKYLKYMNF